MIKSDVITASAGIFYPVIARERSDRGNPLNWFNFLKMAAKPYRLPQAWRDMPLHELGEVSPLHELGEVSPLHELGEVSPLHELGEVSPLHELGEVSPLATLAMMRIPVTEHYSCPSLKK